MSTLLYNYELGDYERVPDEKVQDLVLAGGHAFGKDQEVSILLPNGQGYKVSGEKAMKALSLGAAFESDTAALKREYKEEYGGGFGNALLAFGAGVGRGVTLGVSDAVLTESGFADPRVLDTYREEFGGLSLTGEIGGAVLPALFTGGTGALGAAARLTPSGAVSLLSTKVGQQTAKTLIAKSATDSLLRKTAQVGVSTGVAGGLEGGIYGAGIELSDYVLKDKPKSAEQIMSNIGFSAVLGGGLGTALGGGLVLSLGSAKALVEKSVRMIEKVSDSKLVEGFTDTVGSVIAKATGEDPATVKRLLKMGKKDQAGKFGELDEAISESEKVLKSIREEEAALKINKVRNKVAESTRRRVEAEAIGAREEAFEDLAAGLEREKRAIADELSDEEMTMLLDDLDLHGKIDEIGGNIHALRKSSSDAKMSFIEDNLGLVERHVLDKQKEIERLAVLNESAQQTRNIIRKKDIAAKDSLSDIRTSLEDARLMSKNDLAGLRRQRADFIGRFSEEQLDAGLIQLREQGQLGEEILDLAKMTKEQKREFAIDNAELMFRKAETDAERVEIFRTIQEKMVADRALKIKLSDDVLAQREKVREAAKGVKSEMDELISGADDQFADLTKDAAIYLDDAVEGMEELNTFFQASGVEGGGAVKEGFFSQLLPKIGAGSDETTRSALAGALNIARRLEGVEAVLGQSDDVFFGAASGGYSRLLNNFRGRVSRAILEVANKASTSKGGPRIYVALDDMTTGQLQKAAEDFLTGTGFKSSAEANRAIFREVDDLKRRLQEQFYRRSFKQKSPDQRAHSGLKKIFEEIDGTFLKDRSLFGDEAVDMYTEMNSAMSEYLKTRGFFESAFFQRSLDYRRGESKTGRLGSVLRNIHKTGHSTLNDRRTLMRFLDASEGLQRQFARYYPKEVAAPGRALVKGKPGAPVSGLRAGFSETVTRAREGIDRVRSKIAQAEKNRHSMDAFEAITGQRIHLDEVGDDVAVYLRGYSAKLDDLAVARSELDSLTRLRRSLGSDTFEEAKLFAVETKEVAAALQKTLKGAKVNEVQTMAILADKRAALIKERELLKTKIASEKLKAGAEKTGVIQRLEKQRVAMSSRFDKIESDFRKAQEKVKSTVRHAIEEERVILDNIAKEANDLKNAGKLRVTHERYASAKLRAGRDKELLVIQREIAEKERQIKVHRSRQAANKKNYVAGKKRSSRRLDEIGQRLQREKTKLKNDLKKIKDEHKEAKLHDADQINQQELRLLMRKSAAQDILINAQKAKGEGGLGSAVLAGALGSVPFGLGGGVVTGLAVSMTKPTSFARITTGMWAMTEATEKALARGVDSIVDSLIGKAVPAAPTNRVNRLPLFLGSLSALAEADTPGERKHEYTRARERLTTLATNQELLMGKLKESTKDVGEVDPEMSEELQIQTANVVGFLHEHLPASSPGMGRGVLARDIPPTDAEIRKGIELVELAEDPVGVFCRRVAEGTISRQEILMCQACYPELLSSCGAAVQEKLAMRKQEALESGRPSPRMSYSKRIILDKISGGQVEGTLTGEFLLGFSQMVGQQDQGPATQTKGKNFNPLKKGVDRATLPLQAAMESVPT